MIDENQMPGVYKGIIEKQLAIYNESRSIQVVNEIPDTTNIPIENPNHWLKIKDLICVFVDMKGSTQLSANLYDRSTAGAYQLFTGTAIDIFHQFETPYIDIKGDGVFALFNRNQAYRAIAAAVTFKTFASKVFTPTMEKKTNINVGAHIGIDQKTVLVRKLGKKRYSQRTDRQNEVWAGKPINMASKLAGIGDSDELLVSERYYKSISHMFVRKSCGCSTGEKIDLWESVDVFQEQKFDFDTAYRLKSSWCNKHGKLYCEAILKLDE